MKIHLITGLDGSGKSSLFQRLKESSDTKKAFLHVPYFEVTELPDSFLHSQLCIGLNEMGTNADTLQLPLLKIYALFGAMSLFSSIENCFKKEGKSVLFCERHPLIDAPIYALAYRTYMHPERWENDVFEQIDALFSSEMTKILQLVNCFEHTDSSPSRQLLHFIYNLFGNQTPTLEQLKAVFACQFPDRIYFLDAPVPILMNRIANRAIKEHHEHEAQLTQLRKAYLTSLAAFPHVMVINAESFEALDQFAEQLIELDATL
jgi:thymidylate kinase